MLRERNILVKLQCSRSTTTSIAKNLHRNHRLNPQLLNLHGMMPAKRRRVHLAMSFKKNIWGPCGRRF
jgi:RNA:NAD 2'-phosphotransferase (TPT1/KptA family)